MYLEYLPIEEFGIIKKVGKTAKEVVKHPVKTAEAGIEGGTKVAVAGVKGVTKVAGEGVKGSFKILGKISSGVGSFFKPLIYAIVIILILYILFKIYY